MIRHREFLTKNVNFKQVVELDPDIKEKVHIVFRVQYLKDTALARFMDDGLMSNLNQVYCIDSQEIVSYIMKNSQLLNELFDKMRSQDRLEEKQSAIEFFFELSQMSKNIHF